MDREDQRPSGLASVENRDLARQLIDFVRLHPPRGVEPDLAVLVLEGTMQVGKSYRPLTEWLSYRTGRSLSLSDVRRLYRAVAAACQTFLRREHL